MPIINGVAKSADEGFYPTTIDQSLRFNSADSAYLSRTPASAGLRHPQVIVRLGLGVVGLSAAA